MARPNYITLFHDLKPGRLLFASEGRDAGTVKTFAPYLSSHGGDPDATTAGCIDMSRAYIAGIGKLLPNAVITFDRFYATQQAKVSQEEVRCDEGAFKHIRWMWLRDKHSWTKRQIARHQDLLRMHLKMSRAVRINEALREMLAATTTRAEAEDWLSAWFRWVRRGNLVHFKKFARALKTHCNGILSSFEIAPSNVSVKAINGLIQADKARTRGYQKPINLDLMAHMIAGNLSHLPTSPNSTTFGPLAE